MNINGLLLQKNMTKYRLAKESKVPQTTVTDICSGKAKLEKCSADTVYKLAKVLGVAMETLLEDAMEHRSAFEIFKSNVCHTVKDMGDIDFIVDALNSDRVRELYEKQWYPESLYLLAMLDYLCRENNLPLCANYGAIRKRRLSEPLFPASVIALSAASKSDMPKVNGMKAAIPEFLRFNIIENEVRNVY